MRKYVKAKKFNNLEIKTPTSEKKFTWTGKDGKGFNDFIDDVENDKYYKHDEEDDSKYVDDEAEEVDTEEIEEEDDVEELYLEARRENARLRERVVELSVQITTMKLDAEKEKALIAQLEERIMKFSINLSQVE